jgi:hypothetical protein
MNHCSAENVDGSNLCRGDKVVDAPKLSDSQNIRDPDIDVEILLTYNMLYGKFLLSLYVELVSYPRFLLTRCKQ